jgi:hypothetical protein
LGAQALRRRTFNVRRSRQAGRKLAEFASACNPERSPASNPDSSSFSGVTYGANGRALAYAVTPVVQVEGEHLAISNTLQS